MHADSEMVLLDLLSDELSGHLTKNQRLNAVAAIAELSTKPAEAKLAKIADSQELEPEARAAALQALVAGRPDRLARWLDAGGEGDASRWRRLADLRHRGIELDLVQVGWLKRLLLSLKARQVDVADFQPDLLASGVRGGLGLLVVLVAMLPFGLQGLEGGDIARLSVPALVIAAAHVWLLGKIATPVASSPDRWMFMLPETAGIFISSFLLGLATAATLFAAGLLPTARAEDVLFCAALHGCLVALVRLVCLLMYGLIQDAGRRQVAGLLVGALAAVVALSTGALQAVLSADFANLPWLLELNFLLAAALPALGYSFAHLDTSLGRRPPLDQPLLRLAMISPCLLALLLGATPYAGSVASLEDTSSQIDLRGLSADGAPVVRVVPYKTVLSIVSPWNQDITLHARAEEDIKLGLDGELFDGDSPDNLSESRNVSTQVGREHKVWVQTYSDSSVAGDGMGRSALFGNAARALFDAIEFPLRTDSTQPQVNDSGSPGLARIELRANVASWEIEAIKEFERWAQDRSNPREDSLSPTGYGVAVDNLSATSSGADTADSATATERVDSWRLAKGSIVYVAPETAALSLAAGRASGLPSRLPGGTAKLTREIVWLGDELPEANFLKQAMAVVELVGAVDSGELVKPEWITLLVDGQPELAELVRTGGTPSEHGALAVNYPAIRSTGRGGLFQVLRIDDDMADVQLVNGWLGPDETLQECYRIRLKDLLHHRSYAAETYRSALDAAHVAALSQHVVIDPDKIPAGTMAECADWHFLPTLDALIEEKGRYLDKFEIDLTSPAPPPVFHHYFVVIDDGGWGPLPGAIVRGSDWDRTTNPAYEIKQGWTDCAPTCYIEAASLTYLGPDLNPEFLELPEHFRHSIWSSDQHARYATTQWWGETSEPVIKTHAPSQPPSGQWADIAAAKGRWIESFGVELAASEPPPVFQEYFVVVGEDGFHSGTVPPGTIVLGQGWDTDGAPSFAIVYGWSSEGQRSQYLEATQLAHLGRDFKPGWLELPVLGGQFAEHYAFGDWRTEFVQSICEDLQLEGCSDSGSPRP